MRTTIIPLAIAANLLASAAFGQAAGTASSDTAQPPAAVGTGTSTPGNPPEIGSPLLPATSNGLDQVASDGVSTRTVPAAPCSTAARETDGFTTCVGIPGPIRSPRSGALRDGSTTGMAR
jgi:hypothetical protein